MVFPMGHGQEALPGVDAFACLRSLRAHSALDAASLGQRGWVEIAVAAVGQCNSFRAVAHTPPGISRSCRRSPPRGTDCHQRVERRRGPRHTSMLGADRYAIAASLPNQKFPANVNVYSPALVEASEAIASAVRRTAGPSDTRNSDKRFNTAPLRPSTLGARPDLLPTPRARG